MTGLGLSDAHLVLLAVQLCLRGDISRLPALTHRAPRTLHLDLIYRIVLTFLPESIEPERYTGVIQQLIDGSAPSPDDVLDADASSSSIQALSEADARHQVRHLRLLPLRCPATTLDPSAPSLVQFLVHRATRIDAEAGLQLHIPELVDPFLSTTADVLREWTASVVLPAIRFNYEYHPESEGALSLSLLQSLDSRSAVNILLSAAERHDNGGDVGRDLRGLVGPWMYGHLRSERRRLDGAHVDVEEGWQCVNDWILSASIRDFHLAVEAVEQWSGPPDINLGEYELQDELLTMDTDRLMHRYAQASLASIYALSEGGYGLIAGVARMLSRVADFVNFNDPLHINSADLSPLSVDTSALQNVLPQQFLHNMLLSSSNPLTYPTDQSIRFTDAILVSIRILDRYGRWMSPRTAAELVLLGHEESQLFELRKLLETLHHHHTSLQTGWSQIRNSLLWLQHWGSNTEPNPRMPRGLFWRVPIQRVERELLVAMLMAKEYNLAVETYLSSGPLSRDEVESAVTDTIFVSYDNATNGNRSRGGMRRAADILNAFKPHFPGSVTFQQISCLISATHAMSFYSLTLQHGVPFQPVSIRVHSDPISLIEKVLEQNPKGYTQLDDLLAIGRNLVSAGLPSPGVDAAQSTCEQATVTAERRIMSLAIAAAVDASDFDTAYSYVVTRVIPPSLVPGGDSDGEDDISWRAAYNTGRHRPTTTTAQDSPTSTTLASSIVRLSQRMELLSLALVLAPSPEYLPEILAVWRRCDEELSSLHDQELQEAARWDLQGEQGRMSSGAGAAALPGGFGPSGSELDALDTEWERERRARSTRQPQRPKPSGYEEAPMGLFDVARGAASALRKNAFPLAAADRTVTAAAAAGDGGGAEAGAEGETVTRTRKRDVVSNLVTGGLVSGIGWVIGAPPAGSSGRTTD